MRSCGELRKLLILLSVAKKVVEEEAELRKDEGVLRTQNRPPLPLASVAWVGGGP